MKLKTDCLCTHLLDGATDLLLCPSCPSLHSLTPPLSNGILIYFKVSHRYQYHLQLITYMEDMKLNDGLVLCF